MSFSDWLHQPKVGRSLGLAIALLLAAAIGSGLWLTMPSEPAHQSLEPFPAFFDAIDPECAALLANPASFPGTTPYKIDDCEDKAVAQRKGYRDLDQATRSANAAEDAAWLSLLQARASVIGAAFLVLTLFATAWAAWAAADAAQIAERGVAAAVQAAKASEDGVKTSERFFIADRRPWVGVMNVDPGGALFVGDTGISSVFVVTIRNFGPSPAEKTTVSLAAFPLDQMEEAEAFSQHQEEPRLQMGATVFPTETNHSLNIGVGYPPSQGTRPFKTGHSVLLAGAVRYEFSAAGRAFHTPFIYLLARVDGQALGSVSRTEKTDIRIHSWIGVPRPT